MKKLLSLLTSVVVILLLSSCGDDFDDQMQPIGGLGDKEPCVLVLPNHSKVSFDECDFNKYLYSIGSYYIKDKTTGLGLRSFSCTFSEEVIGDLREALSGQEMFFKSVSFDGRDLFEGLPGGEFSEDMVTRKCVQGKIYLSSITDTHIIVYFDHLKFHIKDGDYYIYGYQEFKIN